jgi:hypothetical protein
LPDPPGGPENLVKTTPCFQKTIKIAPNRSTHHGRPPENCRFVNAGEICGLTKSLSIAFILADAFEMWRAWNELRRVADPSRSPGAAANFTGAERVRLGSIWKMSGNVLEERYRVISFQLESLRHLENVMAKWGPANLSEQANKTLVQKLNDCRAKATNFAKGL